MELNQNKTERKQKMNETKTAEAAELKYQLINHGIDHSQYFQGCGVSFTSFEDCATGCGDNFAEALDDCLESIAQNDSDLAQRIEDAICADEVAKPWPTTPSADAEFRTANDLSEDDETDDCEMYYYVSIRY